MFRLFCGLVSLKDALSVLMRVSLSAVRCHSLVGLVFVLLAVCAGSTDAQFVQQPPTARQRKVPAGHVFACQ